MVLLPERTAGETTNIVYSDVLEHMQENPELAAFVASFSKLLPLHHTMTVVVVIEV